MTDFPNEKTKNYEKPPKETDLIGLLGQGKITFPPARFELLDDRKSQARFNGYDGALRAEWGRGEAIYGFEYQSSSSPSALQTALLRVQGTEKDGLLPLVILPYLSEETLSLLDKRAISGIDLCGNGVLISPAFRLWSTGRPNKFKDTRPIRNPFTGDSSIFARCFLLRQDFPSLAALQQFAQERIFDVYEGMPRQGLALGTASKVVKNLEDELVVRKDDKRIVLQDARRLLTLLRRGQRPLDQVRVIGKTLLSHAEIWNRLADARNAGTFRAVVTGISSAGRYHALSGVERLSIYVDDLTAASAALALQPGKAFANIELIESCKNVVYFDARREGDIYWASPIQTYLELISAGPREQEAATELERLLADGQGAVL